MELPHLGKHCSNKACNRLDFLPIRCDACNQLFCEEHYKYTTHNCHNAYKKNNQVPVCPLCNIPIPVGPNQQPDVIVGMHIDNDCQSDHMKNRPKVFANRCSFKNCKGKEVIPIVCRDCSYNYCLKHRHPSDHKCEGEVAARRKQILQAAMSRSRQQNGVSNNIQQRFTDTQGNMNEDEALARALALSMEDNAVMDKRQQEQLDLALARQLQEAESQHRSRSGRSRDNNRCNVF